MRVTTQLRYAMPAYYLQGLFTNYIMQLRWLSNWEFVAESVIQATGTVEFEDGLRTGVLPGGCRGP